MFRIVGIFCFNLLLIISSCRQPDTPVSAPASLPKVSSMADKTFNYPVVVFLYPGEAKTDSLKKLLGENGFYKLSDINGAEFASLRRIADENNLTTWSGNAGTYRFVNSEGAIIEMDISRVASPWKVILFNGKDSPVLADPGKAIDQLVQTFGIRHKMTAQKPRKTGNNFQPAEITDLQPVRQEESFNSTPGLKETTLRLMLFPGQSPPPLRNATPGIRIVSSYISPHHRFWLKFDNDMFSNTDRYYTNGVVLGYTAPGLTTRGLNRLMITCNRNSIVHSSLSLHHGMFTPLTTKEPPTLVNDRPYSSTLYIRYSQVSEDALAGIRLISAMEAGVIGDAALGRLLQRSVHAGLPSNDEPLGWETQIKNDVVFNYTVGLQKQLVKSRNTEVYADGSLNAGTLHTNATMGINAVAGVFTAGLTPLPAGYDQLSIPAHKWQYGIRGGLELRMIGYDASLQGGLFNRDNVYALKPDELERLVAAIHLGLFVNYRKLGISISQFYLSPEFKEGRQHFWGQVGVEIGY